MSYRQILREISSRGLRITATGADLRLQGPKDRIDADLVRMIRAHKTELITYLEAPGSFGLTDLQRSYLVGRGDAFEIGNVSSHVYREIEGRWDLDRLEAALNAVVTRHGMLRTRFTADGRQVEEQSVRVHIERCDLRGLSDSEQHKRRMESREQRSHRVLSADEAPLVLAEVTILTDDRMVLHLSHDGLVMDGISAFLFFREWWSRYHTDAEPGAEPDVEPGIRPDTEPEAPFAEYVAALEKASTRAPAIRSREYWLARLADLAPHPDLPLRTSPASITQPRFTQHVARLDQADWATVKAHAANAGLTPSGLLMTAYAEVLSRWGAGVRFTLNTTVANRPPIHPRIFHAIGNFSQTMLVEIEVDRQLTFAERGRALQTRLRRELDNRHFSGVEVMRELARHRCDNARMPFTFNSAIGYVHRDLDGSVLELFGPEVYNSSQTPQVWLNVFAFEQHGGVVVQFDSVDGLFPDGLIEAMVAGYQILLDTLHDPAAWSATSFDLLPAAQQERRRTANDTVAVVAGSGLLSDAVLAQAGRTPNAPAIITSGTSMTYAELIRRATQVAGWLREAQVGRDELVGLVMHRGPEQIVGILGTVLAGAAYLPIDASLPVERQNYMLADGGVRCVLTNAPRREADGPLVLLLDSTAPAGPAVGSVVGNVAGGVTHLPGANPDDLAYVLYTSGTTGQPKGVMVSHRSVANVVADCNARFGIGAGDRFFGISAFNFDLSVYDVFGALSAGAAIVVPDRDKASDAAHWLHLCAAAGVTVWNSVPAIVALLADQAATDGYESLSRLRLVMMSGDRIPPTLPATLRRLNESAEYRGAKSLEIVSLGGPTETTIWNILHPITADTDGVESIPYGRPNANNRAYVLDRDGLDAPDWVTGEICAAGVGLARGYWRDETRTAERFFVDSGRGERLFRTGDLGCYLPDGDIAILGRSDFQIKLNGYRIEAGEVETRLIALDPVRQAAVVGQPVAGAPVGGQPRGVRLVAHLVPAGTDRPTVAEIRDVLRTHLPDYMIPSAVVWHEALPLTGNGKVDRARLTSSTAFSPTVDTEDVAPNTELERQVAELWATVLGSADLGANHTLYELGGDSMAAARILTAVRKRFGVAITLDRLSEVETIHAMAARIGSARADGGGAR